MCSNRLRYEHRPIRKRSWLCNFLYFIYASIGSQHRLCPFKYRLLPNGAHWIVDIRFRAYRFDVPRPRRGTLRIAVLLSVNFFLRARLEVCSSSSFGVSDHQISFRHVYCSASQIFCNQYHEGVYFAVDLTVGQTNRDLSDHPRCKRLPT